MTQQLETLGAKRQRDLNEKHDKMTKQAQGKRCARCKGSVSVAWLEGDYKFRCGCYPIIPTMETPDLEGERLGGMVNQALVLSKSEQQIKRLSEDVVTTYLCQFATKAEAWLFIRMCQALDLNPFVREAYLIKYDKNARAAFVIGLQAHIKWASRNPQYAGYEAGVVVQTEKRVEYRDGSLLLPGESLVGGWCRVHRKDWAVAPKHTVSLQEYDKHQSLWKTHPATMIEVTAIRQALRRAFPEDVGYQFQLAQQQATVEGLDVSQDEPVDVSEAVVLDDPAQIAKAVDDLYGLKAEPAPAPQMPASAPRMAQAAPAAPGVETNVSPSPKTGEISVPKSLMEFLNTCLKVYKLDRPAVLKLLGLNSVTLIADVAEAWYAVQQKMAAKELDA